VIGFMIGRALQGQVPAPKLGLWARRFFTSAAILITLAGMILAAPWREITGLENVYLVNPAWLGTFSKTNLHVTRVADVVAKLWLIIVLVPASSRWLRSGLAQVFVQMGRHSLEVFALGTVVAIAAGILLTAYAFAPWLLVVVNLVGIAVMIGLALLLAWHRDTSRTAQLRSVAALPMAE
jgi:hypothetical protein